MDGGMCSFAPPPRRVPLNIALQVLFGRQSDIISWLAFALSLIPLWYWLTITDFSALLYRADQWKSTTGVVTDCTPYRERNGFSFFYGFTYKGPRGAEMSGRCHTRSSNLEKGQPCEVEYVAEKPSAARIKGMNLKMKNHYIMLLAFPIMTVILILTNMLYGFRTISLLANGEIGLGTLKSKTSSTEKGKTLYHLTFEFTCRSGSPCFHTVVTEKPENYEDEDHEKLLYDPGDPLKVVMIDSLPFVFQCDESGRIADRPFPFAALILPVLSIPGLIAVIYYGLSA